MTEQKLDPRIIRTKEAIQSVFKKMVCEMPYEKITVKAITQAAESRPLKGIDQSVRNILLTFNNCVVLLYRQWVSDGRKIPLEEMIELATTLLEKGMKGFRNK